MNKPDEPFSQEQVDEQLDALAQARDPSLSSGSRLVANLHAIYQEDEEIVESVWARLATHAAERRETGAQSSLLPIVQEHQLKGPQAMQSPFTEKPQRRNRFQWLEILAAVLIIGALVGSMAFLLQKRNSLQDHRKAATPTVVPPTSPTPASGNQSGLYVTTLDGVDRINPSTGKIIWHTGSGSTENLLVEPGIVIFSGGDTMGPGNTSNYYVEAVHATSGTPIWRKSFGIIYDLQGANGIVAVSSCSPTGSCAIDALKVSNGKQLWSYPSAQGTIWELYQDGIIYGVSYTNFFALHLSTGMPLWQKNLHQYPNMEANMNPLVSDQRLYFAACNYTKQTPNQGACDFFAFNAISGEELWHKPMNNAEQAVVPTVMDGVVYTATLQGIIYAFNASTGAFLWSYNAGGFIWESLVSDQGLIYVEVWPARTAMHLLALSVKGSSHAVAWSKNLQQAEDSSSRITPVLENGLIYVLDDFTINPNNPIPAYRAIVAFHAESGEPTPGYRPATAPIVSLFFVS